VFGLGFSEMVVIAIVLLVVVGPKELPKLLRSLGRGISKLRQMSTELRDQSGIDNIISDEGLGEDLRAIRSLSRAGMVDALVDSAARPPRRRRSRAGAADDDELSGPFGVDDEDEEAADEPEGFPPPRDKEYPLIGCDAYDALPDDAEPYDPYADAGLPTEAEIAAAEAAAAEAAAAEAAAAEAAAEDAAADEGDADEGDADEGPRDATDAAEGLA
jgi:sec-independent protein translocase protein TatB